MLAADEILSQADRLLAEGRLVECVLTLADAFELALASCVSSVLIPHSDGSDQPTPAELQMLRKRYLSTVGSMSLGALGNVAINLITLGIRPRTVPKALETLERKIKRFESTLPTSEQFEAIGDADTRFTVMSIRDCSIIELRKAVIHQGAQPQREEVERQRDEVGKLLRAVVRVSNRT